MVPLVVLFRLLPSIKFIYFYVFVEGDVAPFRAHFDSCISGRMEMATFARFRGTANGETHWPTFELRGHPYYSPGQLECRYFFAVARPYPSQNPAPYGLPSLTSVV